MKIGKTIIKISLLIVVIGIFFITSFNSISYAEVVTQELGETISPTEAPRTLLDALKDATQFLKGGKDQSKGDFAKDALDGIFNALYIVGSLLTLIIGGFLGIKFMAASAEEKAKIKESMIPYILGCVIIFGAVGIWRLVITILNGM